MYDNTFSLIQDALVVLENIETYEEDTQRKLDTLEKILTQAMFNEPRMIDGLLSSMG